MIEVIDGRKHPEWVKDLLEDYSKANASIGMDFNGKVSESVIAVKDGAPVGIMMFDREPSFRIGLIHTYPEHDDSFEPMLKSVVAMAAFQGKDSVTVHSISSNRNLIEILHGLGFTNYANCPCSLRENTIHMKYCF